MTDQLVYTVLEMARLLKVSRGSAYELVNSGVIRSVRVQRSIRVPHSAVLEFLGENSNADPKAGAATNTALNDQEEDRHGPS